MAAIPSKVEEKQISDATLTVEEKEEQEKPSLANEAKKEELEELVKEKSVEKTQELASAETSRKKTKAAPLPSMMTSASSIHASIPIPSIKARTSAYSNLSISTKTSSLLPPVAPSSAKTGGAPGGWSSHRTFGMKFPPPKLQIDTDPANRPRIPPFQSLTPKAIGELSSKKLTSLYASNPSIPSGVSSAGDLSQYEPPRPGVHQTRTHHFATTNNVGVWMYDSPQNAYSLSPHPIQYQQQQQHPASRQPMPMVGHKNPFHMNGAPVGFQSLPSPRMQQQHFQQTHQIFFPPAPQHTPGMVHCVSPTNAQFLPPLVTATALHSAASFLDRRPDSTNEARPEHLVTTAFDSSSTSSVRSPTSSILANFLPTAPPRGPNVNVKDLTLNELRPHFNKPMAVVAKELGVCITLMKKICRRNGLIRWPHRRIRSLVNRITSLQVIAGNSIGSERKRFQTQITALRDELSMVIQNPNEKSRKAQADAKARSPTSASPSGVKTTTKGKRSKEENDNEAADDDLDEEDDEEEETENDATIGASIGAKRLHTKVSPLCGAMKQQQKHLLVANNSGDSTEKLKTEVTSDSNTTNGSNISVTGTKKRKSFFDEPVKKEEEIDQSPSSTGITAALPSPPIKIPRLEDHITKHETGEEMASSTGGNQKRGSISSILC